MSSPYRHLSPIIIFTMSLITVMAFLHVHSVQAILPILHDYYQADSVEIGLASGGSILAMGLLSPFIGMLSDAYGRDNFIRWSMLFVSLPIFLSIFAPNIHVFILFRFLLGLFIPAMTVCLIAYIAEEFKGKNLAKLMSIYVMSSVLGGFCGRFLLGYLSNFYTWQTAMKIFSIINLIAGIWVFIFFPKSKRFIANSNFNASIVILKKHLFNRSLVASCLLGFCILSSLIACFSFIGLRLTENPYNFNTSDLANIFAVYLIGMLITPITTWSLKRFGTIKTMSMAVSISIIGSLLSLFSSIYIIIIALIFICTSAFITQSATISHISLSVNEGRSLANGLYYLGYYGGGFIGAWIAGLAYGLLKWNGIVLFLLIINMFSLFIILLILNKTNNKN